MSIAAVHDSNKMNIAIIKYIPICTNTKKNILLYVVTLQVGLLRKLFSNQYFIH